MRRMLSVLIILLGLAWAQQFSVGVSLADLTASSQGNLANATSIGLHFNVYNLIQFGFGTNVGVDLRTGLDIVNLGGSSALAILLSPVVRGTFDISGLGTSGLSYYVGPHLRIAGILSFGLDTGLEVSFGNFGAFGDFAATLASPGNGVLALRGGVLYHF